jgi:membrane protein DedA with SNARE-associated domain/rhodanese-related sulfurtransferase
MAGLIALLVQHGVLLVFLVTLAARVGAPLPAAPLLVVAGGLVVQQRLGLHTVLLASLLANLLGDAVWFGAGRRYGARVLALLCRISLSPDSCVRQSESLIVRWGGSALVAAKFVPGVSVVAAPMAGAVGMSTLRFVAFALLGGVVWSVLFLGLGALFHEQIDWLLDLLAQIGTTAALVLLVALAGFVGWRWWRRRRYLQAADLPRVAPRELKALLDGEAAPLLIDVRSSEALDIDARHIPGALQAGLREIELHAHRVPGDREVVLYCNCPNEASAALAARMLMKAGHRRVRPLAAGLDGWAAAGWDVAIGRPRGLIEHLETLDVTLDTAPRGILYG